VLPDRLAYRLTRRLNIARQRLIYSLSMRHPRLVRRLIRALTKLQLPSGYAVDTHFKPSYNPWEQRLCAVPDGDLFKAIRKGQASVVTDRIACFTERGILLESGTELEADVIVTATGLNMVPFGKIALHVDEQPVDLHDHLTYKSLMVSEVPNFVFTVGYANHSWTLKADLVADYLCRLLAHMDRHGYATVTPVVDDPTLTRRPFLEMGSGYVNRAMHLFPQQGSRGPWTVDQSYRVDRVRLGKAPIEDPALRFTEAKVRSVAAPFAVGAPLGAAV
jgi:cation diffusion facilitator CzcD-associated flavoprotein CzcO